MNKSSLKFYLLLVLVVLIPLNVFSQDKKEFFGTFENNLQSKDNLKELKFLVEKSSFLTKNWVFIEKISDTPDKLQLKQIHKKEIPGTLNKLDKLSQNWEPAQQEQLSIIKTRLTDTLIVMQEYIMKTLASFEDYDDAYKMFVTMARMETDGEVHVYTEMVLAEIRNLLMQFETATETSLDVLKSKCDK